MQTAPAPHRVRALPHRCICVLFSCGLLLNGSSGTLLAQPAENSPETLFLQLVDMVAERAKQLELLDAFVLQFPKYEGMGAIYAQMQTLCVGLQLWDRALGAGDKVLAIDPDDSLAIAQNLAAAEGKKDEAMAAKWRERLNQIDAQIAAVTASPAARIFADAAAAAGPGVVNLGSARGQQRLRVEAAQFNRVLQQKDAKSRLQLLSAFLKEFPSSAHTVTVRYFVFATYRELEDHEKALPIAEAILQRDQTRADVLLYTAQRYFAANRDSEKVLAYSAAVETLLGGMTKPEQLKKQEWEEQKKQIAVECHLMKGAVLLGQEQWSDADKSFRAALPLAEADSETRANILTNLGWANYKLKNIPEAVKFYEECVAIDSSLKTVAAERVASIKTEFHMP